MSRRDATSPARWRPTAPRCVSHSTLDLRRGGGGGRGKERKGTRAGEIAWHMSCGGRYRRCGLGLA
eukprot:scaffold96332_cov32-Tisochrysis_lutea.AAC.2